MRFNASKCHILSLQHSSSFSYQLNSTILQRVTSDSYLGIQISQDLKWGPHISGITKRLTALSASFAETYANAHQPAGTPPTWPSSDPFWSTALPCWIPN